MINSGKSINMCKLLERKARQSQEYSNIVFTHMNFEKYTHESDVQKKVTTNEAEKRRGKHDVKILKNYYERTFLENHKQTAVKENKLEHQATNYLKMESNIASKRIKCLRSHPFHSLTNIKDMLMISILLLSTLTTVKASVTVNQTEIVVKKGEEVELVCTSSKSEALGCSFKSPAEHNYNMLRGAAYEEGRIQQKELNPNDCAMKITNIRQGALKVWAKHFSQ